MREAIGFDGLLLTDDLSMKALGGTLGERARAPRSPPASTSRCIATATSPRRAEVAEASPELEGALRQRAEAALARIAAGPRPFDVAEGRAELAGYGLG